MTSQPSSVTAVYTAFRAAPKPARSSHRTVCLDRAYCPSCAHYGFRSIQWPFVKASLAVTLMNEAVCAQTIRDGTEADRKKLAQHPNLLTSGSGISYNRENCLKLASLSNSDNEGKGKIFHSYMSLPISFSSPKNYYLDEFSSLLDELLVKIDGLSDSLELSSLEKEWRGTVESRTAESPLVGIPGHHAAAVRLCRLLLFFLTFYTAIFIF